MQVLKHHSFANHSKQAIKTPSTTHELYTIYKRMIYRPHLLISIASEEKKDESTN